MRRREKTAKVIKHLVLFVGAIIMLIPFAWMILTAFKTNTEAMQMNPFVIFPSEWRTDSFVSVAEKMDFVRLYTNTEQSSMPLAAALAKLQGQFASNFPELMAASMIACIPMIVLYLIFQKQFIEGIATSGGKL